MALVELPGSPGPFQVAWELIDYGNTQRGALGGATQRVNRLGGRWAVNIAMPTMTPAQAREWSARLSRGLENGVYWAIDQHGSPTGSPGSVLVNGASQAGSQLVCDGATPGFVAQVGMFCTVTTGGQRYCYQVAEAAQADTSGNLTLTITPRLRVEPANNDSVNLGAPEIEGLLSGPPGWSLDVDTLTRGFSFRIEETR